MLRWLCLQNIRDHGTEYLIDPWEYLGPKRRSLLEKGWPGLFRDYLLHRLPVERLGACYNETMGRPSKELYQMLGTIILQQVFDLTDEQVQWHVCFDQSWHYALDIVNPSDQDSYVCEKTIWNYRQIVLEKGLDEVLFADLTDELAEVFKVDTSKQRMDSTHVCSNMRRLGRMRIFAQAIHGFLVALKRKHARTYETLISAELQKRYMDKKAFGCFSQVKPSESQNTLEQVARDLLLLVETFKHDKQISDMKSYHLLQRILHEQCIVTDSKDGEDPKIELKPPKDVPSDSLQNPSDPDAGYSGHKGQGFTAQIMETYTTREDDADQEDPPILNLITYIEVSPAHVGDSDALIPALEETSQRGCTPKEVTADTHYGGDENVRQAASRGVELVSPSHYSDGRNGTLGIKDFEIDTSSGTVRVCPEGHAAVETHRTPKKRIVTTFDYTVCQACPQQNRCPVRLKHSHAALYYTDKRIRLALRRQYEQTEEFRDRYRWRAGIEGTNSRLKSQTGAGRLRVRGLANVRFAIRLKALGLNILRAARVRAARICQPPLVESLSQPFLEHLIGLTTGFAQFVGNQFSKSTRVISTVV